MSKGTTTSTGPGTQLLRQHLRPATAVEDARAAGPQDVRRRLRARRLRRPDPHAARHPRLRERGTARRRRSLARPHRQTGHDERSRPFMTVLYESNETAWELLNRGKVRDVYELGGRAPDRRHRPHLGLRRHPADADPREGQRAHADLRLLVRQDAAHRAEPHRRPGAVRRRRRARAPRRTLGRRAPGAGAARRGDRARLSHRLGAQGLRAHRHGLRHPAAARVSSRRAACRADLHAVDQGRDRRPRREHRLRRTSSASSARDLAAQVRDAALALYRFGAAYALERGIIIADTKFEFGLLDGRARSSSTR